MAAWGYEFYLLMLKVSSHAESISLHGRVMSSISLPKTKNVRDVSLVCFKPPTSRSLAYCDCNPLLVTKDMYFYLLMNKDFIYLFI